MQYDIRINHMDDAFEVRRRVFVEEQGFENEFDEIDDIATHITMYNSDGELVGCARTFPESPDAPNWVLGRVSVLPEFRGQGCATEIICAAEDIARELGAEVMRLHAQSYVVELYSKLGYMVVSNVDYADGGHPHVWMEKRLSATDRVAV